ncbi:uncharacterized protein BDV14DRAFT_71645 [Aspergillus stella-maris]|uniref:uncharacterized protein n=1 Tax=Aspergillus stella-maris TaxID=1810926 RepID=UPI003CCCE220
MGLFFCPRLRGHRDASNSSDGGPDYQLDQSRSGRNPQGVSPTIDESPIQHRDRSSGSISSKLRRRFSRDAKDSNQQLKRVHRFPLLHTIKPLVPQQTPANYGLGGSLMSEGGYDSDAQHIATPKPYTTDYPASRLRNGIVKPASRPPIPLSRSNLEPSQEQTIGLAVTSKNPADEQSCYPGKRTDSQSSWRPRDLNLQDRQVAQASPTSLQNVDLSSIRGSPSNPNPEKSRDSTQQALAPAPSAVPLRVQEVRCSLTPTVNSSEDSTGRRSSRANGTGVIISPTPQAPAQQSQGYTTSVDSLGDCPPRISVKKRHQRPYKEITHGEQSIHLGDMNIRRILASSGSTPQLQPQDQLIDENRTSGTTGTWNSYRYQSNQAAMPPILDDAEAVSPPILPGSIQDPRSPYSLKSTISSAELEEQNIPSFCQGSSGNTSSRRRYLSSGHASASGVTDIEANALKSKFTERFGSDRSVSAAGDEAHEGDASVPSRRISIGWMSEGRRIGYGYELVPPENARDDKVQTHSEPVLAGNCGSVQASPKESPSSNHAGHPEKQKPSSAEEGGQEPPKTREPSFDISAIFQKLNITRWAGANFAIRTSNNSDAASCDSGGSSLFGMLTNKKKPIEEVGPNLDTEDPWEFCSWVRPRQSSGGQQAPQQDTIRSREYTEAQLMERLSTFRRRKGTSTTKRKVSEIARNLEKRADRAVDRLAVRRTATRVLRLREPGRKERRRGMHVTDPTFPTTQFDGLSDAHTRRSERLSSGSSGWDSLYEECLEECSLPD